MRQRLRIVVRVRPFLQTDCHASWPVPSHEESAFFSPDDSQLIVRLPEPTEAMRAHIDHTLTESLGTGGHGAQVQTSSDYIAAIQRKMRLPKQFTFDHVFDDMQQQRSKQLESNQLQQSFFDSCGVIPLLESVLQGYSACVLSVGQTGSGKTFTMSGASFHDANLAQIDDADGLLPRSLSWIFAQLAKTNSLAQVSVSFVELYNEQLFDMLAVALGSQQAADLRLRWVPSANAPANSAAAQSSGSFVLTGQIQIPIESVHEAMILFREASKHRHIRQHQKNRESSRSHAIFMIQVTQQTGDTSRSQGTIYLCDLAGSENLKQSQSHVTADPLYDLINQDSGLYIVHGDDMAARVVRSKSNRRQQMSETGNINRSLMTLGQCIALLAAQSSMDPHQASSIFLPLRNSKLTKLLSSTLTGQSMALIVCCVAPWSWSSGLQDSNLMSSAGLCCVFLCTVRISLPSLFFLQFHCPH